MKAPDVALVRKVAAHHRAELLERCGELADDGHFVTGASWSVRALDRVLRACDGETDPERLGLTPAPEPAPVADEPGLF